MDSTANPPWSAAALDGCQWQMNTDDTPMSDLTSHGHGGALGTMEGGGGGYDFLPHGHGGTGVVVGATSGTPSSSAVGAAMISRWEHFALGQSSIAASGSSSALMHHEPVHARHFFKEHPASEHHQHPMDLHHVQHGLHFADQNHHLRQQLQELKRSQTTQAASALAAAEAEAEAEATGDLGPPQPLSHLSTMRQNTSRTALAASIAGNSMHQDPQQLLQDPFYRPSSRCPDTTNTLFSFHGMSEARQQEANHAYECHFQIHEPVDTHCHTRHPAAGTATSEFDTMGCNGQVTGTPQQQATSSDKSPSFSSSLDAASKTLAQIRARCREANVVTPSPSYHKEAHLINHKGVDLRPFPSCKTKTTPTDDGNALYLPHNDQLTGITAAHVSCHQKPSVTKRGSNRKPKKVFLKNSPPVTRTDHKAARAQARALLGTDNAEEAKLAADMLRGVTIRPSGKWQAQYYYAGKSRYLGVFDTREKACLAYEIARKKLHGSLNDIKKQTFQETKEKVFLARNAALAAVRHGKK